MASKFTFKGVSYISTPLGRMSYTWYSQNKQLLGFYYSAESKDWVFLLQTVKAYSNNYQNKMEARAIDMPIRYYNFKIAIAKAQKKKWNRDTKFIYSDDLSDEILEKAKQYNFGDEYIPEQEMKKNYSELSRELNVEL
jgi:hypothetical protein